MSYLFTLFPIDLSRKIIFFLLKQQQIDIWLEKNKVILGNTGKYEYIIDKNIVDVFKVYDEKEDEITMNICKSSIVDNISNISLKANEEYQIKNYMNIYTGLIIETENNEKVSIKIKLCHGCEYITHQFDVQGLQRVPFIITSDCSSQFWKMFIIPNKPIILDLEGYLYDRNIFKLFNSYLYFPDLELRFNNGILYSPRHCPTSIYKNKNLEPYRLKAFNYSIDPCSNCGDKRPHKGIFIPCGHYVECYKCISNYRKCSLCSKGDMVFKIV